MDDLEWIVKQCGVSRTMDYRGFIISNGDIIEIGREAGSKAFYHCDIFGTYPIREKHNVICYRVSEKELNLKIPHLITIPELVTLLNIDLDKFTSLYIDKFGTERRKTEPDHFEIFKINKETFKDDLKNKLYDLCLFKGIDTE